MKEERKKKLDDIVGKYKSSLEVLRGMEKAFQLQKEATDEIIGMGEMNSEEKEYFTNVLQPLLKEADTFVNFFMKVEAESNKYRQKDNAPDNGMYT